MAETAPTEWGLGTWELDLASGSMALDQSMAGLLGVDELCLDLASFLALVTPESQTAFRDCLQQAIERGQDCEVAYQLQRDAEVRHHVGRLKIAPGSAGRQVLGYVVDVSQAVRSESALRTSEEERLVALQTWGVGTWSWDLATGALNWSSTMEPLLGLKAGDFGGSLRAFLAAVHAEDRPLVQRALRDAVHLGQDFDEVFRCVWPDGSVHWIAGKGRVYRDAQGTPSRVLGLGMEVTRDVLRRTRQEMLLRLARLLAAEPDVTSILQAFLREVLPVFRADYGVVYRWQGDSRTLRAVAVAPADLELPPPPLGGAAVECIAKGCPIQAGGHGPLESSWAKLVEGGVRTNLAVPLLHAGSVLGAVEIGCIGVDCSFSQDDTALLEVSAGLAAAALVGVERTRLEAVLLAGRTAQHEVNNLLALTVGYGDIIADDPRLPEDLRAAARLAVQGAEDAAERLRRLASIQTVQEVHTAGLAPVMDLSPGQVQPDPKSEPG
jgi:PAS domain-containing protein